jgi:hypothetical protein
MALTLALAMAIPVTGGAQTAEEALTQARCTAPRPALDAWLKGNAPSEAQVRAVFARNGRSIRRDSPINAYFTWLAAGRDHAAAAAAYHKGVTGYARDFACWK